MELLRWFFLEEKCLQQIYPRPIHPDQQRSCKSGRISSSSDPRFLLTNLLNSKRVQQVFQGPRVQGRRCQRACARESKLHPFLSISVPGAVRFSGAHCDIQV